MGYNVVFDIGGVMAEWDPGSWFRRKFGEELGLQVFSAAMGNGLWGDQVDRGTVTEAEFFARQREKYHYLSTELSVTENYWREILRPKEDTAALIHRLKAAGYRVYYLSNFPKKTFLELRDAMPVFAEMDGGVASWEIHKIKPEPEIYRMLLERYQLRGSETVFTDDAPANVEAAKALGLFAWRFEGAAGFEKYLKDQLGMRF